ncbi:MAG: ribosome silencing factor [Nitrospinae bacterium]|nr:ribosome silencing factor [Nitrospinota bacterium]
MTIKDKAFLSYNFAVDKKALNIVIFDIRRYTSIADAFLICSGTSSRHVQAIADAVEEGMREKGIRSHHREGYETGKWILLDYVDLVVHIFHEETRRFYNLERLWGDAESIVFDSGEDTIHKETVIHKQKRGIRLIDKG